MITFGPTPLVAASSILPERTLLQAVEDGETDVWEALAASVTSGAKRIYIRKPEVGYRILIPDRNAPLTLPEGVIIETDDEGVSLVFDSLDGSGTLNQNTLLLAGGDNCGLVGVTLDGGSENRSALAGFKAVGHSGLLFRRVSMANVYSQGLLLTDVTSTEIEDLHVEGRAYACLQIDGDSSGIKGRRIEGNSDRGFGVWLGDTAHDCELDDVRSTDGGLETVGITARAHNNLVTNVLSIRSGDNGVSITGYQNQLIGARIYEAWYNGVCLYGQENIADDVTAVNCGQYNAAPPGGVTIDLAAVSITPAFGGTGHKNTVGRVVAIDTQPVPTMQYQVQIKVTTYTPWASGAVVAAGVYRTANNIVYKSTTAGTTGVTTPVHTSGTASDGGVTWEYCNASVALSDTSYPTLWASGVAVLAGEVRTHLYNRYKAAGAGTTGATPPTHLIGSASDDTITWEFIEQVPANLDGFDNVISKPVGDRGAKGWVDAPTSNKNTLHAPGRIREGVLGRNIYSDIIFTSQNPNGTIDAPSGSIALRRDSNANLIGLAVKDSQLTSAGWRQTAMVTSGNTASRPTLGIGQPGTPYFDTTLAKPIWWDGTDWKDASGSTV